MTIHVRRVDDADEDLEAIEAIVNAVSPDDPTSVEDMRWSDRTYPGGARFLATLDGRAVGAASVGRIYMYPPEFPAFYARVNVVPADRRRGVGSELLAAVSEHAEAAAKRELMIPASEGRPDGVAFLLHRGFREYERSKSVRLRTTGMTPPPVDAPPGIEVTTLAERPDLVVGVHRVAGEAFPDIPGGGEPPSVGDLDAFRARDVDRPSIPHDAFMVALDSSTDEVLGYASLILAPGDQRRLAWHDMTAVARAWRGRGVAIALKRATIRWAIDNGLDELRTSNDPDNAPMRAVNATLGYEPLPDRLLMRGPLFGAMMDRS
jgi:mycothiol synthase